MPLQKSQMIKSKQIDSVISFFLLFIDNANLPRSGRLNAKNRELMDLQQQAQARLARTRERFAEGMRDAREVRSDLEWTQKKVS